MYATESIEKYTKHEDLRTLRLYFPGFMHTEWSAAYLSAIDRIAVEFMIERRESVLDHHAMAHIVAMSVDHPAAKYAIADSFLLSLCLSIGATFDVFLVASIEKLEEREIVAKYDFGQPDARVVDTVLQTLRRQLGTVPELVPETDHVVVWLIYWLNVVRSTAVAGASKDCYADILEAFKRDDIIYSLVKGAIDRNKLSERLQRPMDAIAASRQFEAK
jgi:hypothetical protein